MRKASSAFCRSDITDDRRLQDMVFDAHTKLLEKPLALRDLIAMLGEVGRR